MSAISRAIWVRNVEVKIALSNPGSTPGDLNPMEACYGNGWKCEDVAAEFIKRIKKHDSSATDDQIKLRVRSNLKLCYVKGEKNGKWKDGQAMGMHAKHFIIDDCCYYIGSQNLYIADLAEWGLFKDNKPQTDRILNEYWNPLWHNSYD